MNYTLFSASLGPQGNPLLWILAAIIGIVLGLVVGYLSARSRLRAEQEKNQLTAKDIFNQAEERAKQVELDATDSALKMTREAENDIQRRRTELTREDDRLVKRREELDRRFDSIQQREANLNRRQSALDKKTNDIDTIYEQKMQELQKVAELTTEDAKAQLLAEVEKTSRDDMARIIRQIEAEAREEGQQKARELIADAIQRVASDKVAEVTTSVVPLPNEEMKGRIVGRNGRNIRAFEQAAGVDVIVDDTPEAVTISCFEPVRREVARRSLTRLILDGRIHPANIEKVLEDEQKAVDKIIVEAGEQAAFDAGVTGLHPE